MSIWDRLKGTFRREAVESRLDDEVQFHIEMRTEEYIRAGYGEREARAMARRKLGNATLVKEQAREMDLYLWIENWVRDCKQSWRMLRKRPVFATTAIASLAIGIGSVTALFSVVDAVVWRPISLPNSQDLFYIEEFKKGQESGSNGARLKDWQTLSSMSAVTGEYTESAVWKGPNGAEAVTCLRTFSSAVRTLQPVVSRGRTFTSAEEDSAQPVALLTHEFWRRRFAGSDAAIGQTMELGGRAHQVIGVLAHFVGYPDGIDAWVPAPMDLQQGSRNAGYLSIYGRIKPGVSRDQAQAEVNVMAKRLAETHPETDVRLQANLVPLREKITEEARTPLLVLLAVVACVLLMICVNISALLLARASERQRESSMRSALGASTGSLMRLYLSETLLITAAGAVLGTLVAMAGVDVLKAVLPASTPRLVDAGVDSRVLLFAVGLSVVAGLLAGLIPSWIASRAPSLQLDSRTTGTRRNQLLRSGFVVAEVALSCLLVSTAVRMAETFVEMSQRPLAFQTSQTYAVAIPFEWTTPAERLASFGQGALREFATLPGVSQVGLVDRFPMRGGTQSTNDLEVEGVAAGEGTGYQSGMRAASSSYFATIGVPLLKGRLFTDRAKVREAVVNQAFIRKNLPAGMDPIGRKISFNKGKSWYEITGVIGDVRQEPQQVEAAPEAFIFYQNAYWPMLHFAVRSNAPLTVLAPQIRQAVSKLDGMALITRLGTMDEAVGEATRQPRVRSLLVGSFALLALLLAAIGVHGLIAADLAARWKEFGVRLALGGTLQKLRLIVVSKTLRLLVAGGSLGVAAVAASSQILESSVDGLQPARITTALLTGGLLLLAALAAILWPLRKVAKIDPISALRHD
jgi:putative ABC transport system permease protein